MFPGKKDYFYSDIYPKDVLPEKKPVHFCIAQIWGKGDSRAQIVLNTFLTAYFPQHLCI